MPLEHLAAAAAWDLLGWPLFRSAVPSRFATSRAPGEGKALRRIEQAIEGSALLSEAFTEPAWALPAPPEAGGGGRGGAGGAPGDGPTPGGGCAAGSALARCVAALAAWPVRALRRAAGGAPGREAGGSAGGAALRKLVDAAPIDISRVYAVDPSYHDRPLWAAVPAPGEPGPAGGAGSGLSEGDGPAGEIYRPVARFLKLRRVIQHRGGQANLSPALLEWYSAAPYLTGDLRAAGRRAAVRLRREDPALAARLGGAGLGGAGPGGGREPAYFASTAAPAPSAPYAPLGPRQVREAMSYLAAEVLLAEEVERLALSGRG